MALPKNKKLPKKGNKKKGDGMFGEYAGYKGVNKRKVKRLVGGVIRDEVRDLRQERKGIRREARRVNRTIRRDYRRGKGDLKHVFGETGDFLEHLAQQNQQNYAQQSQSASAAGAALQQQLNNTYTGAADQVNAELSRLGIQGGGNLSQLISDQAHASAMGNQASANAQSTLDLAAGNSQQLSNLVQGMNQGSFMSARGQNLNNRNDALFENRQDRMDNFNRIRNALGEVRGSRDDLYFQLLNSLQETGWGQYMDMQQLKLARRNSKKK